MLGLTPTSLLIWPTMRLSASGTARQLLNGRPIAHSSGWTVPSRPDGINKPGQSMLPDRRWISPLAVRCSATNKRSYPQTHRLAQSRTMAQHVDIASRHPPGGLPAREPSTQPPSFQRTWSNRMDPGSISKQDRSPRRCDRRSKARRHRRRRRPGDTGRPGRADVAQGISQRRGPTNSTSWQRSH